MRLIGLAVVLTACLALAPLVVEGQQAMKVYRIGVLGNENNPPAKHYARQILDGSLSPYKGAKAIWRELSYELRTDDHTLDPFIFWADMFEETRDPEQRRSCELAILDSARDLVGPEK